MFLHWFVWIYAIIRLKHDFVIHLIFTRSHGFGKLKSLKLHPRFFNTALRTLQMLMKGKSEEEIRCVFDDI